MKSSLNSIFSVLLIGLLSILFSLSGNAKSISDTSTITCQNGQQETHQDKLVHYRLTLVSISCIDGKFPEDAIELSGKISATVSFRGRFAGPAETTYETKTLWSAPKKYADRITCGTKSSLRINRSLDFYASEHNIVKGNYRVSFNNKFFIPMEGFRKDLSYSGSHTTDFPQYVNETKSFYPEFPGVAFGLKVTWRLDKIGG